VIFTGARRQYTFFVTEFVPDMPEATAVARATVRFTVRPAMDGLMKAGDVDTRMAPSRALDRDFARVVSLGASRRETSNTTLYAGEVTQQSFLIQEPMVVTDAVVEIPVVKVADAWSYKGQQIRAGGGLTFETATYTMRGSILSVSVTGAERRTTPQ
jgi:hypothetical protein